jgi:hypothetical protein
MGSPRSKTSSTHNLDRIRSRLAALQPEKVTGTFNFFLFLQQRVIRMKQARTGALCIGAYETP